MHRVYRDYEQRKEAEGALDFEDLLERAVQLFERDELVRETFRAQYRAFTVDEYQDVNLLQQELLEYWLGDRDDLCVVGDDYQSVYGFRGGSPAFLLDWPRRFPHAKRVTPRTELSLHPGDSCLREPAGARSGRLPQESPAIESEWTAADSAGTDR